MKFVACATTAHLRRIDAVTVGTRECPFGAFDLRTAVGLVAVVAAVIQSVAEAVRFDALAIGAQKVLFWAVARF